MKKVTPDADAQAVDTSPSLLIDAKIKDLGDWRGAMLAQVRKLVL
jgi:hypothetical protein